MIEAEWLVTSARPSAGNVRRQDMRNFPDKWSADAQLWWTGSRRGGKLDLEIISPHAGPCDVIIYLTTAVDYPIMRARVEDQPWKSADLYTKEVRQLASPLRWSSVNLEKGQPISVTLEMTGANPAALQRWMLGIDRIEFVPQGTD